MSNPGFTPEFGPNGAVMNSPTMTPRMRAEIERTQRLPTPKELRGALGTPLLIVAFALLIGSSGSPFVQLLKSSPWWAGAFAGALATLAAVMVWRTVRFNLMRWELTPSRQNERALDVPYPARVAFAISDSVAVSAWIIATTWTTADVGREHYMVVFQGGGVASAAALISLALRWYATRRGWRWRAL